MAKIKENASVGNLLSQYNVDSDIDGYNSGCVGCGCNDDGSPLESGEHGWDYCRCFTIESVTINSVSHDGIVDSVCQEFGVKKKDSLAPYGISRIINSYGMFDAANYEVEWSGNYYGEEVDGIRFIGKISEVDASIRVFLAMTTLQAQVEFLLEAEYGHVLDHLKDRKWELASVSKKSLVLGAMQHASNLNDSIVESYEGWDCLIHAICIKDGDRYRVIDGYHRCTALLKSKKRKAHIIYAM